MLNKIVPIKYQLNILQLEEYKIDRYINWLNSNLSRKSLNNTATELKKPLIWTSKAKRILIIAVIVYSVLALYLVSKGGFLGLLLSILLITQPYLFLIAAIAFQKPYEVLNRYITKKTVSTKILNLKKSNLKVIGITGSYGKTSVKEFLYKFLTSKYKILRTPESYNTIFGISKVIEYELDNDYDFFICEMGAYCIGEISEICSMVHPDYGVITGINEQHLERFGNITNTIKAKFELAQNVEKNGLVLINGSNKNILNNYKTFREDCTLYGTDSSSFYIKDVTQTNIGTKFTLVLENIKLDVETPLIGNSNIENILAASALAFKLGVEAEKIKQVIKTLKPIPHRLELKTNHDGLIIIDDAYSSNTTGFKEAINLLKTFTDRTRILATPGIVELGNATEQVHTELGSLLDGCCDKIFLIGHNVRTNSLNRGVTNKEKVVFINSLKDVFTYINKPNKTVLLIENDLPDNY